MRAIDCQGFAGGFTLGAVQAGWELVGKREMAAGFGMANCLANRHLLGYGWDAQAVEPHEWEARPAELVLGNPPCSGFSVLSSKNFRGVDSPINHCMWAFAEFAARVNPQVAIFESVRAAYSQGHSLMLDLRTRLEELTGERWNLTHVKHDAYALGGPAIRRRYFWVASRVPFGVEHPTLPHLPTLDDAIGDLETLGLTWERQGYRSPPTPWSASRRSVTNFVDGHVTPESTTPAGQRILDLARLGVWNQGESMSDAARRSWQEFGSLPPSWNNVPKHVASDFNFGYCSTGRWKANAHARVITGGGPYCTVHPRLDRLITHREIARIMGFPDDWLIAPLRGTRGLASTWGKGITVDAGRWIATWARESILGTPGTIQGEPVGDREYEIAVTKPRVREYDSTDILAFLSHHLKEEEQDGRDHFHSTWPAAVG